MPITAFSFITSSMSKCVLIATKSAKFSYKLDVFLGNHHTAAVELTAMWSELALCVFAGLAYASASSPWKENTEYVYLVNGRTLSSLEEAADQYSGIFLKAKLHMSIRSDGKLQGKLVDPEYAQIQSHLPDGWRSEISESHLSYKPLGLSQKPFQMILEDSLIKKLVVEKDLTNWEANIIKSIVSQFQMDLQGRNAIRSQVNDLPETNRFDGVFKTMEETITGETETLYEIHPLPEYLLQSQPWLAPQRKLREGGDIVEVSKYKNYTNAQEKPSYHYGFGEIKDSEPSSNNMGQFFIRESSSRAILTGKPTRYVIQNSYTINKIMVNPDLKNKEMGSVVSLVNVTLSEVNSQSSKPQELSNPTEIGSLVYTFADPFASNNKVQAKLQGRSMQDRSSEESTEDNMRRLRRSLQMPLSRQAMQHSSEEYTQQQPNPQLSRAPGSPLLPSMVGYHGRSMKGNSDFNVKDNVEKLAEEISEEMQRPEDILKKSTLNKYTILSTLLRLMDEDEIKSVAEQLYSKKQQDESRLAWAVYRDAVAEAGTGPALLNIKQWIESSKIEKREAAEVIASMAQSVRVPTKEYMQKFFDLMKSSVVEQQAYLNESAILSYTNLLHRVYVNQNLSRNQYPVNAYGSFSTKEGREFVKATVIPYLAQKLDESVSSADAHKIHFYIRALGNVGHRRILQAFESYLEGEKQVSQFQRMWIVASLDRLASQNPSIARSVLYKIYQNTAEVPEVRIIAVHQLFRTNPPAEMLQRMAQNTNTDSQEKVNAAVKSAIETASNLESSKSAALRNAAQSAKHLLTRKQYGSDQSYLEIRDYMLREMQGELQHRILEVGSQESNWPKILGLSLNADMNGMNLPTFKVQSILSSMKDLTKVLKQQTEQYQKDRSQRSQQEKSDGSWSSAKIAQQMNYNFEEREQLESVILAQFAHIEKLWSVDNQTLEKLPEVIRQQEDMLKHGKTFSYSKVKQLKELALSFPTEMGIPFLYTYDVPMLLRFEGKIKASSTPQISQNNKLHKPEQINAEIDSYITFSSKVQSHLSFVTPFDHQIYTAGFDRNVQAHIPLKANAEIDAKNKEMKIEFEVQEKHENARALHYSTVPYTSRSDVMNVTPVSLRPNTQVIKRNVKQHRYFDVVFGKKETGLAFRLWGHHPVQSINLGDLASAWRSKQLSSLWSRLWDQGAMQFTAINVAFVPSQSRVRKVALRLRYENDYKTRPTNENDEDILTLSQLSSKLQSQDAQKRQQEIMNHVGSGIKSAELSSTDVSVEFEGDENIKHIFGYAFGKSNADPASRAIIYYQNKGQNKQFAFEMKGRVPNTNALDLTNSLQTEPSAKYNIHAQYGEDNAKVAKISFEFDLQRSQARKQFLTEQEPLYYVCKEQMQQGNFQLAACLNMTLKSNFLDDIKFKIEHENLQQRFAQIAQQAYNALRAYYYPMTEMRTISSQSNIDGRIQFQPEDFRQVNITLAADGQETKFFNISTGSQIVKTIFVQHPVYHLRARIGGLLRGHQMFRQSCVIDQTAAQTFANKTYPLSIGQQHTVVLQYIPKDAPLKADHQHDVHDQLKQQIENYVVLTRQADGEQKEVIVTFNHPKTQGKTVEVKFVATKGQFSASNPAATIQVEGQQVNFDDSNIANLYDGFVQIYALPNGEVKFEIKDAFYVIFDGKRIRITATSDKLYDSTYGLCGRFSGDQNEDFTVPENCVVRDREIFAQSYQVENKKSRRHYRSGEWSQDCVEKVLPLYTDVISDSDIGKSSGEHARKQSGTKLRSRYVEENGEICFSIRPLPVCNGKALNAVTKNIAVHCVQGSKAAYYLKSQIDQGGNPDFSRKHETKTVRMEVPVQCN